MKTKTALTFLGLLYALLAPPALLAQRNWVGHSGEIWATAFGNNTYVVVGQYGLTFSSPDAATWTQQASGVDATLIDVVFAKSAFVAVGTGGTILTSLDGRSWTKRNTGTTATLVGVAFGKDQFVTVGVGGAILSSPDGLTWAPQTAGTTNDLSSVAFNGDLFVAVGADGTLLSSADAVNWTARDSLTTNILIRITAGNSRFVAVGVGGTVITSNDGLTWTSHTVGRGNFISAVTFGNNTFVATDAGKTVSDGFQILTSPDGENWIAVTNRPIDLAPIDYLEGLDFVNGTFVTVGLANVIWTSTDANTWTLRSGTTFNRLRGVAYGNGAFAAVGDFGTALSSPDGTKWTRRDIATSPVLRAVTFGKDQFVAVSQVGTVFTSTTGIDWTERATGTANRLSRIIFANNQFVASGVSGTVITSPDGVTWTIRDTGTSVNLNGVAYGAGIYVVVGNSGTVLTSPDGVKWGSGSSGVAAVLIGLSFGDNTFVATGLDGTILTSPDGVSWTPRRSGTGESITDVTYLSGGFVAVGLSPGTPTGILLTSPDAINWIEQTSGIYEELTGVAFGRNTYVVVGQYGMLLSSLGPMSLAVAPVPRLPKFDVLADTTIGSMDGWNPHPALALADLNHDGIVDIAAGSATGVVVNLRSPDGVRQPNHDYPVGGSVNHLAVADFNEDGNPDLLADVWKRKDLFGGGFRYQPSSFGILLGAGDGTFQSYSELGTTSDYDIAITVADFNGDRHVDIAVVEGDSGQVSVWLGDGHGAFQLKPHLTVPSQAVSILAADLNQDGILDLVIPSSPGSVRAFLGNGDGTFKTPRISAIGFGPIPGTLVASDFNGDGIPDLATGSTDTGNPIKVGISLGNGDGTFRKPMNFDAGWPASIGAADLNGDGILDLIVGDGNVAGNDVSVLLGHGDGTFASRSKVHVASGLRNSIATAVDLNQNGRMDLAVLGVVAGGSQSRIYYATNQGIAPTTTAPDSFQLTLQSVPGATNIIEATSDLLTWSPIYTNANLTGTLRFQNSPPAGTSQRFYRAVEKH